MHSPEDLRAFWRFFVFQANQQYDQSKEAIYLVFDKQITNAWPALGVFNLEPFEIVENLVGVLSLK